MAKRKPISRVRSVTLTSMMFMMPIPPTSKLTAATALSSSVMMRDVPDMVSANWPVSKILKLSSSISDKFRRSRMMAVMSALTCSGSTPSIIDTNNELTCVLPVTRR